MVDIDSTALAEENDPSLSPAERRAIRLEHARRNFGRDRYNPEAARSIPSFRESLRQMMVGVRRRIATSNSDEEKKAV